MDDGLDQYDYVVPDALIARTPATPRDSARMLVYHMRNGALESSIFSSLPQKLPARTLLVFNDTKVIPARLHCLNSRGEQIELFITSITPHTTARALSNRRCAVGDVLVIAPDISVRIVRKEGKESSVELHAPTTWSDVLRQFGETPIPPYLKDTPLSEEELRQEYQTIFAQYEGSVAAPTASLHFTQALVEQLDRAQVGHVFVTLHVNLGTFAPVTREHIVSGKLHEEWYHITEQSLTQLRRAVRDGWTIIPVGTTALRAIESAAEHIVSGEACQGDVVGTTRLFIRPGYIFRVASGLITNFHVPKSSLMMLVAALIGKDALLSLYAHAVREQYRFFSFGDGMLILP